MAISEKYKSQKSETNAQTRHRAKSERGEAVLETHLLSSATNSDGDRGEDIVAALRGFFLTHTFDPLTGEVYTVH